MRLSELVELIERIRERHLMRRPVDLVDAPQLNESPGQSSAWVRDLGRRCAICADTGSLVYRDGRIVCRRYALGGACRWTRNLMHDLGVSQDQAEALIARRIRDL